MAQWLRIHLPVQRAQILSLGGERVHMSWGNEVWTPELLKPSCLEAMLHKRSHPSGKPGHCTDSNFHSLRPEKACMRQGRLSTATHK